MPTVSDLKQQARALEQRGQLGKALAVYQHILKHLEGTTALAKVLPLYVKVGDLLLRLGRTAEAVAAYENAAEQYAQHGSAQRVSALCEKIMRIAPDRTDPYVRFAHRLMTHGHVGSARDVLAAYAEQAHLERASEALDDLAGRPSEEIRPMLERLLKSLQRGEAARSERDAERVSTQLSEVTDAAAGELTGMAVLDMATPPPESAKRRSAYTFEAPDTEEDRRSGEPDPLQPQLIDFGVRPDLPASTPPSPAVEIDHQTPAPEPPPGTFEIDHQTPAPEAPPSTLEIDHQTPAPEPPLEIQPVGAEIDHQTPAPEAPLDARPGGAVAPPAEPTPPPAPPPARRFDPGAGATKPPLGSQPAAKTAPESTRPEPVKSERSAPPRVTTPRVTAPSETRPRPTTERPRTAPRPVLQATGAGRTHKLPVVPALAGFAIGVAVTAALFLSGIVPTGAGTPDESPARGDQAPAQGSEMPTAERTEPATPARDSARGAAAFADTVVPTPPPDTTRQSTSDSVGGLAPLDNVSADSIPDPVLAGAAAVQPEPGDAYPIVIDGLEVESVTAIEFRGQAGYRVVHLLDSGDPLTVESYYLGGEASGTARIGRIVVNITPPDTAVGIVRLERYMVYASAAIPEDSLRTLMTRLVEREGSD